MARVQTQIEAVKAELVATATAGDVAAAKDNLLEYLNRDICARSEFWSTKRGAIEFMARVFSTPVSSAFVEHLFSNMGHWTGGRRSSTELATVTNALHIQSTRALTADAADEGDGAGHFAPDIL